MKDWLHIWHAFVDGGDRTVRLGSYRPACARCGTTEDRAIHSKSYARENGYEFVEADA